MNADASYIAASGLLCATAAFALGIVLALIILSILRSGDSGGTARLSLILVFLSLAIAAGAWAFVLVVRGALDPLSLRWYVFSGGLAGLICGLLPRAAGVPLLTMAIIALVLAATELSAWQPWRTGSWVAEIQVYSTTGDATFCGLSIPGRDAAPIMQNLRLPKGPLILSVDSLIIQGPLAFIYGSRYYRLAMIRPGDGASGSHSFPSRPGLLDGGGTGSPIARIMGMRRSVLYSAILPDSDMARARYYLGSDGQLLSDIQF
jgi:hypothetical protein